MASRVLATALHITAVAVMTWGWTELSKLPQEGWIENQKGGHFQFLTIHGLWLAWAACSLSIITDLFPTLYAIKTAKRSIFIIAMPLAVVISSIYWTLMLWFPNLILPKDPRFTEPTASSTMPQVYRLPLKFDLSLHAAPAISLFLDFILFEVKFSRKAATVGAPLAAILYCIVYGSWVEYCASFNGQFPYPFLTDNTLPVRVGIYIGATLIAFGSFQILNTLRPTAPLLRGAKFNKTR